MSPKVSVIIVNYHSRQYVARLLASLSKSTFRDFEIIIVDNDQLNVGYGAGVNIGEQEALGDYLFILNPDTLVFKDTLQRLVEFLTDHPSVGLVAPLLLDSKSRPYPLQGTRTLTPLSAIFALSFLNKYWPQNPISRWYWLSDWDKSQARSVAVAPGTAFLIRRLAFTQVQGFDPKFFLYFEESDLCRRLLSLRWEVFINPASRLIHYWGKSTPKSGLTADIISTSRRYYFTKHYGSLWSSIVNLVVQ